MPKNGGRSLSISDAVTVALVRVEITQLRPSCWGSSLQVLDLKAL